jgi:hypothetical protein
LLKTDKRYILSFNEFKVNAVISKTVASDIHEKCLDFKKK